MGSAADVLRIGGITINWSDQKGIFYYWDSITLDRSKESSRDSFWHPCKAVTQPLHWARPGASLGPPGGLGELQGAPEAENTVKTTYFHVFCRVSGGARGPPKFVAPGFLRVIWTGDGKRAFSPIVIALSSLCDE